MFLSIIYYTTAVLFCQYYFTHRNPSLHSFLINTNYRGHIESVKA